MSSANMLIACHLTNPTTGLGACKCRALPCGLNVAVPRDSNLPVELSAGARPYVSNYDAPTPRRPRHDARHGR
jgi:hypothetical protein